MFRVCREYPGSLGAFAVLGECLPNKVVFIRECLGWFARARSQVLRFDPNIEVGKEIVAMTTKGEAVAVMVAQMTTAVTLHGTCAEGGWEASQRLIGLHA